MYKYRKIPSTSDEQEQLYKDLLRHVFTSPQHKALKDLGLIEAKIESLDLRVQDNNSFQKYLKHLNLPDNYLVHHNNQ